MDCFEKMLTSEVIKHMEDSIEAAEYEGNNEVCINTGRIISLFVDELTTREYEKFDWEKAEDFLFNKLDELKSKSHKS